MNAYIVCTHWLRYLVVTFISPSRRICHKNSGILNIYYYVIIYFYYYLTCFSSTAKPCDLCFSHVCLTNCSPQGCLWEHTPKLQDFSISLSQGKYFCNIALKDRCLCKIIRSFLQNPLATSKVYVLSCHKISSAFDFMKKMKDTRHEM